MKRIMLLALFSLALPTAVLATSTDPITINFSIVSIGGVAPSYTGNTLQNSTAFNFGTGLLFVSNLGPGDQSGLSAGDSISLSRECFLTETVILVRSPA